MIAGMAKLNPALLVLSALVISAAPALAQSCAGELAAIEKALASEQLSSDVRAQVEDMKKQAEQLCAAGNEQEGLDVMSEVKQILNID
jgi:hypothetical protein